MIWGMYAVALFAALIAMSIALRWRQEIVVWPWQAALLYRDGRFVRVLAAGRHVVYGRPSRIKIVALDIADRSCRFGQMDVVSADRFAFRIQLNARYAVTDPRAAYEASATDIGLGTGDAPALFERVAATALDVVGARTLDEVMADPAAIGAAVLTEVATRLPDHIVREVMLTKVELPPETRRMLTEVERARREGLAALERARGEQAALRALANAARLVRDNPELAQLRLLRTIETAKGPTTIVMGGPAGPATNSTTDPVAPPTAQS